MYPHNTYLFKSANIFFFISNAMCYFILRWFHGLSLLWHVDSNQLLYNTDLSMAASYEIRKKQCYFSVHVALKQEVFYLAAIWNWQKLKNRLIQV